MSNGHGGTKRSSWLVFRRRLIIIRLLMRGPLTKDALVETIQHEMHGEGYLGDIAGAFKNDLDALKAEYDCKIVFRRRSNVYVLDDLGELALLDLPDTCMEALSFLDSSFPRGAAIPEHAYIRDLLDRIMLLLPATRRDHYRDQRRTVSLHITESSADRIDSGVLKKAKRAAELGQELEFEYRNNTADGAVAKHRVAPYEVFFRPDGHCYLDATLLDVRPRDPAAFIPAAIHYRLDRIVPTSIHILPNKLPPLRIQPDVFVVRYWLHPNVARRRDVAEHLPHTIVDYQEDGSALVTATTTNVWQARQTLLRYGSACRVLEPPELVRLFHKAIHEMAQLYDVGSPPLTGEL
ncbi:MAG: WYL domain-containing protein [Chloroflexales bacterium]